MGKGWWLVASGWWRQTASRKSPAPPAAASGLAARSPQPEAKGWWLVASGWWRQTASRNPPAPSAAARGCGLRASGCGWPAAWGLWLGACLLAGCASAPPPDPEQLEELDSRIAELRVRLEEAWLVPAGFRGRVVDVHRDLVRLSAGEVRVGERVELLRDGERVGGAEVYFVGGGAAWAVADEGVPRPGDLVYARRP